MKEELFKNSGGCIQDFALITYTQINSNFIRSASFCLNFWILSDAGDNKTEFLNWIKTEFETLSNNIFETFCQGILYLSWLAKRMSLMKDLNIYFSSDMILILSTKK